MQLRRRLCVHVERESLPSVSLNEGWDERGCRGEGGLAHEDSGEKPASVDAEEGKTREENNKVTREWNAGVAGIFSRSFLSPSHDVRLHPSLRSFASRTLDASLHALPA